MTRSNNTPAPAFYHVAFAVPDLEAAMDTFSQTVGLRWNTPHTATLGEWTYRIVFSVDQPFVELICGPPGSPWDTSTSGARFDHLGWWTQSLDDSVKCFEACPRLTSSYDGRSAGRSFAYFDAPELGARFELVDVDRRPDFLTTWAPPTAGPMDAIDP